MKCVLFKTGSRVEIDVVHVEVYTNFEKRVKSCTIPILADSLSVPYRFRKVSYVFEQLYQYKVREILLPAGSLPRDRLDWPWPDFYCVDEKDVRITYYLGSTARESSAQGFMDIRAIPFAELP